MGRILIIGAGPGGLAAALALKQVGVEVAVFERAAELREIGAGLTLWPNAVKALDRLGVGHELRARGYHAKNGALRRWDGVTLLPMRSEDFEPRFGAPSIPIHRAALQSLLAEAVGSERVTLGAACVGFDDGGDQVVARFEGGREERGDLLVAADGIHSVVRAQIHGKVEPRYAGYLAWRGVAEFDPGRVTPGETWGRGTRFGAIPISANRVYWFATANAPAGTSASPAKNKADVLERFGDWHDPIPDLLRATPDEAILRSDILDREPLTAWGMGRVTLLGDAAHATTPNLGQGACMAIEDAEVLARCVNGLGATAEALRRYEALRIPRTARVVAESRKIGQLGQWANPVACAVRNTLVRLSPPASQVKRMEWLLGYEPPGDVRAG